MKPLKNKEKIVRDLVNTFNDRDMLHKMYKERMKLIFADFICDYCRYQSNLVRNNMSIVDFIDEYIETRFKPSDE